MKRIFICFLLLVFGCCNNPMNYPMHPSFEVVGSHSSHNTWVYLCGLLTDFLPESMEELKVLDSIGKQLNVKFLVIIPTKRCVQLNNRLCWPHKTQEELLETYQKIVNVIHDYPIRGYIGFSNGGFFLNKLAQLIVIDKPIISIGAAGPLFNKEGPCNTIHLLIGKKDCWHYEHAIDLYNQSKDTNLTIHLIEYDEGHEIPEYILKNLITDFLLKNDCR